MVDATSDTAITVWLIGEFDIVGLGEFRRLLRRLLASQLGRIDIDVGRLDLLETMTAAALVQAELRADREGVELRVVGASGPVLALLELTRNRTLQDTVGRRSL